jgi:hypothetical protein
MKKILLTLLSFVLINVLTAQQKNYWFQHLTKENIVTDNAVSRLSFPTTFKLYDLNKVENIEIQPYDLPLNKILINTKNTWFNMYDDVLNRKNPITNLDFKSFFYIGITLIIVVILYVLLSYIFD